MQRIETSLPGVYEFRLTVNEDSRGSFMETYHLQKFRALGIAETFVQDNQSVSKKGTLRGLHYQLKRPQAKLCRVVLGAALDVSVDIRFGSPTFGKSTAVRLSANAHNLIYIPAGFAHGFVALTENMQFLYKCSDFYDRDDERGILWSDPDLNIAWGTTAPIVSEKDSRFSKLADVPREFLPRYEPQ
jgi:dTDP-4-dehydrorhamnose 3,5-epimerase